MIEGVTETTSFVAGTTVTSSPAVRDVTTSKEEMATMFSVEETDVTGFTAAEVTMLRLAVMVGTPSMAAVATMS